MNPTKLLNEFKNSGSIGELIVDKHHEYYMKAKYYSYLYYVTRLATGFSAAALPFVVGQHPQLATVLSGIIATLTVVDIVYSPKDRWTICSKATDLIVIAIIKLGGDYKKYESLLEPLLATETALYGSLVNLKDLENIEASLKKTTTQ